MIWLYDDTGIRALKRAVAVLFVAGLLAFVARGGGRPDDPSLRPVTDGPAPPTAPTIGVLPGEP